MIHQGLFLICCLIFRFPHSFYGIFFVLPVRVESQPLFSLSCQRQADSSSFALLHFPMNKDNPAVLSEGDDSLFLSLALSFYLFLTTLLFFSMQLTHTLLDLAINSVRFNKRLHLSHCVRQFGGLLLGWRGPTCPENNTRL